MLPNDQKDAQISEDHNNDRHQETNECQEEVESALVSEVGGTVQRSGMVFILRPAKQRKWRNEQALGPDHQQQVADAPGRDDSFVPRGPGDCYVSVQTDATQRHHDAGAGDDAEETVGLRYGEKIVKLV